MRTSAVAVVSITLGLQLFRAAWAADASNVADEKQVLDSVTFYVSFDDSINADVGKGPRTPNTRFDHATKKGEFEIERGFDPKIFRINKGQGISGGTLEVTDVLPRRGRIFYPAKGNIAFKKGGWGGSVSLWIKTDPNTMLKLSFCDPIQITEKGADNGGIWFDFNNAKPRDLRMGVFPAVPLGQAAISQTHPRAPMVRVPRIDFKADGWHHVALTWDNFDTGNENARATLYIDAQRMGEVKDANIAMDWNLEKAGIYTAVGYCGWLDELALFDRELTADEVDLLRQNPGVLSRLGKPTRQKK